MDQGRSALRFAFLAFGLYITIMASKGSLYIAHITP